MQQFLDSAVTPMLIFVYLLFALFLISQFERKTRKELRKVKEHLIVIEKEVAKILNPPKRKPVVQVEDDEDMSVPGLSSHITQ